MFYNYKRTAALHLARQLLVGYPLLFVFIISDTGSMRSLPKTDINGLAKKKAV